MPKHLRQKTHARHTLERYTGSSTREFGSHIILVNFPRYVDHFADITGAQIKTGYWSAAHDRQNNISIINFGVGSPSAGIVTHCLSYLEQVECVLMLGMCGGIDDGLNVGDFLIPTASVRDEGTSRHYLPRDVPAQPSFPINRICQQIIRNETGTKPHSGIMLTTDYRMWEFDTEFTEYILKHRIMAIDMETATIFAVAYALNLAAGAIMLVSDLPLQKGGIKSKESAKKVFRQHTERHIDIVLKTFAEMKQQQ
ncbi:MAG: AMP nucleosidase [Deltaproteobacteria bacterium]|nr:AMP nucleosidase [Deltaproteobacteria bacterium]